MDSNAPQFEDPVPLFYIGHHDQKRDYPITEDVLQHARSCNYDMLTVPITTNAFYTRVTTELASYRAALQNSSHGLDGTTLALPAPVLENISCHDPSNPETHLQPSSFVPQQILTSASWIDLASPDPLIADLSRQVLSLELQYAAFCGATNVLVPGPILNRRGAHDGFTRYARAVSEALALAPYVQIQVLLPMGSASDEDDEEQSGIFNLSSHANEKYAGPPTMAVADQPILDVDEFTSWDAWNAIRSTLNYSPRVSVALILPKTLPSPPIQDRWFCEPLRILYLRQQTFNTKNHLQRRMEVSLSSAQASLLFRYMGLRTVPWLILSDIGPLPGIDGVSGAVQGYKKTSSVGDVSGDPTPAQAQQASQAKSSPQNHGGLYVKYLRQLQNKQPRKDAIDQFSAGYQDYLQNPLQPLTDNLESMTYEVFEKDPIKYDWYERATTAALSDWKAKKKPCSGPDGAVVIAVVGAGRGPLVTRALQASQATGVKADVWAVEKNPNAFALLQHHVSEKWNMRVNLVKSDMRSWLGPFHYPQGAATAGDSSKRKVHYKVDILISELLGSFGDNELSPECLDGVQHVMAPKYGISIPRSYTAHLTPVAAPKLHQEISSRSTQGNIEAAELPYVVKLHAIDYLSKEETPRAGNEEQRTGKRGSGGLAAPPVVPVVKQAWEFSHPSRAPQVLEPSLTSVDHRNDHNRRVTRLGFPCKDQGVCHGLGGYFEAVLYDPGDDADDTSLMESSATADVGALVISSEINKTGVPQPAALHETQAVQKVELSTNPLTMDVKSKDMLSWFPIYFPLKTPLYIPDNSILQVSMWRQTDGRKVWYEWMVEAFMTLPSENQKDRMVRLGMTDLHSSLETACLM